MNILNLYLMGTLDRSSTQKTLLKKLFRVVALSEFVAEVARTIRIVQSAIKYEKLFPIHISQRS